MLTALIGLAGIVVGAILSGLVDQLKQWRQERALLSGVVRVLELDLIELDSQVHWWMDAGLIRFSPSEAERMTGTWLKYRELLARKLTPDEWSEVARVFQTTLVWTDRDGDAVQEADRDHMSRWLTRIERAQDILGAWPPQARGRAIAPHSEVGV